MAVAGRTATISKVCPDGTGSVAATGSDRGAAWGGSLACPAVAVGPCPSVVATLTSATGCFTTLGVTMRFVGAK